MPFFESLSSQACYLACGLLRIHSLKRPELKGRAETSMNQYLLKSFHMTSSSQNGLSLTSESQALLESSVHLLNMSRALESMWMRSPDRPFGSYTFCTLLRVYDTYAV